MSKAPHFAPDVTLALDPDGVIQAAVPAESLADESLDDWRGLRWADIVPLEAADDVERAVSSVYGENGAFFTVNQRLPSGRELVLEYATVRLGRSAGLIAIGKSINSVSELSNRLAHVQREREQDYWKLRDVETRYRALLDASSEAVVLVRAANMRVVESNVAATRSLGLVPGSEFLPDLGEADRRTLHSLLRVARMEGRAPGVMLHLAGEEPWSLRAATLTGEGGSYYLLQMAPLRDPEPNRLAEIPFSLDELIGRLPEGFLVVDREGVVVHANATFADLVQVGSESAVIGKNARQWLSKPGTGLRGVMNLVEDNGSVRGLRTTLEGELGVSLDVEISAIGDQPARSHHFGLLVRDVASQALARESQSLWTLVESLPDASLGNVVRSSVEVIERQKIVDALESAAGNRTLAAKGLGLSRQSLYAKLKRYKLR
jgi:transcriptional regulator PpsR